MPKLNPPRAAAVYAVGGRRDHEALMPALEKRRLYAIDRRVETLSDLALPVAERPVLRLCLLHSSQGAPSGAEAFVTDTWANLGADEVERVAVVGALQSYGCEVVVGEEEVNGRWYQSKVKRLSYPKVGKVLERLMGTWSIPEEMWDRWELAEALDWLGLPSGVKHRGFAVLPTSLGLDYAASRRRALELAEFHGMTITEIADRLMAEGYPNADDRRIWYPKAVRDALDRGL